MTYRSPHFKRATQISRSWPSGWSSYNKSLRLLGNKDEEAFRLNLKAASDGMHDAVLAMGWFYLNGCGVEADENEAIRCYRKEARQGDSRALFSLGQIAYWRRDYAEAFQWFTRAISKGHQRSKFYLGKMYWKGYEVERDQKTARRLFAEAAAGNVSEAQRAERFLSFLGRRLNQNLS